ncbi:hypothetical protein ES319_1Z211400v1 [Gossypium barbadense]|uniref:Uncharacterized protein n=1 Tax=Gossypium barbadense TaxID=3634 RepID=A0A5J5NC39_GOSBA|nr:hypothetical protein ES319_1Z211400v1 [Gossypium barbadense]
MKRIWLSMKFSYIYEASPSTNLAFFMQSLYAHTISHMVNVDSLTCRLGGLYCLYCLYETQPFKPPFKIYLSLREMEKLKTLVAEAKEMGIKVVPALVKRMMETNMFLFGFVDLNEGSDARLFTDTAIEQYISMDLKMSTEYEVAKRKAIEEAGKVVDVQNIKHISENEEPLSEIRSILSADRIDPQNPAEPQQLQLQLKEGDAENNDADEFYQLLYQHD